MQVSRADGLDYPKTLDKIRSLAQEAEMVGGLDERQKRMCRQWVELAGGKAQDIETMTAEGERWIEPLPRQDTTGLSRPEMVMANVSQVTNEYDINILEARGLFSGDYPIDGDLVLRKFYGIFYMMETNNSLPAELRKWFTDTLTRNLKQYGVLEDRDYRQDAFRDKYAQSYEDALRDNAGDPFTVQTMQEWMRDRSGELRWAFRSNWKKKMDAARSSPDSVRDLEWAKDNSVQVIKSFMSHFEKLLGREE